MGSAEKHSWPGGGQGLFPCLGSMIKGQQYFRRRTRMHLGRMLTNLHTHAHHTEGVQYAIKSFVWGVYALQTRAATPMETMKSAKRGFHRGLFSSISNKTLFMRSVSAPFVKPPKY